MLFHRAGDALPPSRCRSPASADACTRESCLTSDQEISKTVSSDLPFHFEVNEVGRHLLRGEKAELREMVLKTKVLEEFGDAAWRELRRPEAEPGSGRADGSEGGRWAKP